MDGRSPAGPLIREHRVIERMIAVLDGALSRLQREEGIDPELIAQAVDFIRGYADRCHHGKEEDILFRRLAEKPLDEQLAITMQGLIADHVRGRALTRELHEANERYRAGEESAAGTIETSLRSLISFYPMHIEKEDKHFFKPAIGYLDAAERAQMLRDFERFDASLVHERYLALVERCEASGEPTARRPRG